MITERYSSAEKKQLAFLGIWLAAGIGMIVMGVLSVINRAKTLAAVSGVLGTFALAAAVLTAVVRIYQVKTSGKRNFSLDWILLAALSFLLYNTDIFNSLGKLAFITGGSVLAAEGIRAFFAAFSRRHEEAWFMPRIIFSFIIFILGIIVIINAEKIFQGMIVLAAGIFFIVHGLNILNDWIGRVKYFRNFRGLDKDE